MSRKSPIGALLLLFVLLARASGHWVSHKETDNEAANVNVQQLQGDESEQGVATAALSSKGPAPAADQYNHDYEEHAALDGAGEPTWYTGVYVLRTVTLVSGQDALAHLIRTDEEPPSQSELLEMDVTKVASEVALIVPGSHIRVSAFRSAQHHIYVQEVHEITQEEELAADTAALDGSDVKVATLAVSARSAPWQQGDTVTDVPTLFMITGICDKMPVVTVDELSRAIFDGEGSRAYTLEGFYRECSQGKAYMNSRNSKVVGPITIPCSYAGNGYSFSGQSCQYSDSEGWMRYASEQAVNLYGVDLSLYRHRVLLMPQYYIYEAGCPWMGLGTLGPDTTFSNGAYQYSSVWLTGELWKQPAAFFHELGHTLYLHHAAQFGGCAYCDLSSTMGDCCDIRCLNPVQNWQLGWGSPIATLSTGNMAVGSQLAFVLPAQQTREDNMLMIMPDWIPGYGRNVRGFAVFVGFRTESGRYDSGLASNYVFASNIYWWDGQAQHMARYTYIAGSVGTSQEYRNETWGLSIKQLSASYNNATITVCRFSEAVETSCFDGIDNDCNGLVDFADPNCIPGMPIAKSISGVFNQRPMAPLAPPPGMPGDYPGPDTPMYPSPEPGPPGAPGDAPPPAAAPPSPKPKGGKAPSPVAKKPSPHNGKKPAPKRARPPWPLPKWKMKPPPPPPPPPADGMMDPRQELETAAAVAVSVANPATETVIVDTPVSEAPATTSAALSSDSVQPICDGPACQYDTYAPEAYTDSAGAESTGGAPQGNDSGSAPSTGGKGPAGSATDGGKGDSQSPNQGSSPNGQSGDSGSTSSGSSAGSSSGSGAANAGDGARGAASQAEPLEQQPPALVDVEQTQARRLLQHDGGADGAQSAATGAGGGSGASEGAPQYAADAWDPAKVHGQQRHLSEGVQGDGSTDTGNEGYVPPLPDPIRELFPGMTDAQIWTVIALPPQPEDASTGPKAALLGVLPPRDHIEREASVKRWLDAVLAASESLLPSKERRSLQEAGKVPGSADSVAGTLSADGKTQDSCKPDSSAQGHVVGQQRKLTQAAGDLTPGQCTEGEALREDDDVHGEQVLEERKPEQRIERAVESEEDDDPHRDTDLRVKFKLVKEGRTSSSLRP